MKIGIVGVGLIGGSIAMRARAVDPDIQILGWSRRQESMDYAISKRIIDQQVTEISGFDGADIVFVCTPIPQVWDTLVELDNVITSPTILTDVASLKGALDREVATREWRHPVVLGHPMAGKETIGVDSADSELLKGKTYILIQNPGNGDAVGRLREILEHWEISVLEMSAMDHDQMVAYASHLPYLASILAVGMAERHVVKSEMFSKIVASGFRDTTRVASSDPWWGADVLIGNSDDVLAGIQDALALLGDVKKLIENKKRDELIDFLGKLKGFRERMYKK